MGQYVAAGSQLLFLVPDTLWVVANYKEGQTWDGDRPATFSVDAFQGQVLRGRVQEIAPATGSEFSVLRPDNASGNTRWCSGCRCGYRSTGIRSWQSSCGPACR